MFSTQPGAGDQVSEGCVVVPLQDEEEQFQPSTLYNLLRLARKYIVDELQEEILDYLKFVFPSTLEAYRSPARIVTICQDFNPMLGVETAPEFEIQAILPAALYMPALLSIATKVDGFEETYGTIVKPTTSVLRSVLLFEEHMQELIDEQEDDDCWLDPLRCSGERRCTGLDTDVQSASRRWYRGVRDDVFRSKLRLNAFDTTCDDCLSRFRKFEKDRRADLWEPSHDFFGLIRRPDWMFSRTQQRRRAD
ncbi:hypothetical protein BV25DRAFT_1237461 [Artomyces pyxidatus]|uniref:Uncharacterized protein n=1 Tax=Artomyces pyxidatus TaxID=48021 RepID=A0ACB8SPT7_9AGAM|nr:hypothetical protein BV25DRAFT_1237461 [Artomyces pyxidatus]